MGGAGNGVYRYERSGVLHGLLRVRGFTQDDAHLFCTPEQMEDEILGVLRFSLSIWKDFGFTDIKAYLATKPEKSVGDTADWDRAIVSLKKAIDAESLDYEMDEGGGAFYGPKDRPEDKGRPGAGMADDHDPVRLQPARALRYDLCRSRREGKASLHDPQGPSGGPWSDSSAC